VSSVFDARILLVVALYVVLGWLIFRAVGPVGEPRSRVSLVMGLALLVLPFVPASGLFMEVTVNFTCTISKPTNTFYLICLTA
jgi:hypothetical protein